MRLRFAGADRQEDVREQGWLRGQPVRFVQGHSGRLRPKGVLRYEIDERTGCWVWGRALTSRGYGHLTINKRQILAHRFVYATQVGPIPDGWDVHHRCENKRCINPDHLEPLPHVDNSRCSVKAKLDSKAAAGIRRLAASGVSLMQLAVRFGVDRRTIRAVLNGETWS